MTLLSFSSQAGEQVVPPHLPDLVIRTITAQDIAPCTGTAVTLLRSALGS